MRFEGTTVSGDFFLHGLTAIVARAFPLVRIQDDTQTHSDTRHSVGLLLTSEQLLAETSTRKKHNTHKKRISMPPVGFEPAIPASELPQTKALDRAATGIGR